MHLPKELDVNSLIQAFTEERRYLKGVSEATLEWYKYSFRSVLPFINAARNAVELHQSLKTAAMQMSAAGVKPVTINDRFRCINAWAAWLFQNGHIADRIKIPFLKEPEKITPTFAAEDVRRLTTCRPKSCRERRGQAMACLILDCGLRVQEAIDLCIEDVNLEDLLLTVRAGKGKKGRVVPISRAVRQVLWPWLKGREGTSLVFSTKFGDSLDQRAALRHLDILLGRLGIKGPRKAWHALRHTFALNYIRAGGDVFRLQRILGHSSLEMTRRYVNLQTEDLQRVHEKFSVLARSTS